MSALLLLASCTDDYKDWTTPQVVAQPTITTFTNGSVTSATTTTPIDIDAALTAGEDSVKVANITAPTSSDAAYTPFYTLDFVNGGSLAIDNEGRVAVADLQAYMLEKYGKDDVQRDMDATISMWLNNGTTDVKMATSDVFTISAKLPAPEFATFIYEIGNSHGWSTSMPLFCKDSDGKYQGYYYLNGGFKFKPHADNWDGDWGQDPNGPEGALIDDGEQDCQAAAGFYQIDVDLVAMTYKITAVNSISIIGTVNGSWDTDTDMTYNTTTGAWEVTTTLNAGKMKFRMNHDWTISWGGANGDSTAYSNLTQHGGTDLDLTEAGTYKIELYITYEGNNKVVITKL